MILSYIFQIPNVDCPNGDDERHCIALAHHLDSTEEMSYSNSGTVQFIKLPWQQRTEPSLALLKLGVKYPQYL